MKYRFPKGSIGFESKEFTIWKFLMLLDKVGIVKRHIINNENWWVIK